MSNYNKALGLLNDYPETRVESMEAMMMRASALASLSVADALTAAHAPEVNEVHLIHAYDPVSDVVLKVVVAHRDRTKAYAVRDEMNQKAEQLGQTDRYIVKTVGLV